MKLVLYNDYQLGIIRDNTVVDAMSAVQGLDHHSPQELMTMVITGWDQIRPQIERATQGQQGVALDSVRLRPPLPRPGQIVCLAGNYLEHGSTDKGDFNGFFKPPTAVIGYGDTCELTTKTATVFHFEPELGVVIGKPASRLSQAGAMDYIFGYTNFIDASARGVGNGFFLQKSWHTSASMGPYLVTVDDIPDPQKLRVRLWVNDKMRHDFSTRSMGRHLPEVLEEVTNAFPLEPGDLISTGTHHEGLRAIKDTDEVRMEIDGLGTLVINVHDSLKRTWLDE
jgi:2-keto-4-pentenoate hydratase/2-oxohepta-3-ene-1,7-dioic acid hydratase in catechol pathway